MKSSTNVLGNFILRLFPAIGRELEEAAASRERKRFEDEREKLMLDVRKRIVQLSIMHQTSRLLQDTTQSVDELLQSVVNLLPAAWQYAEVAVARIKANDKEFRTPRFAEMRWRLESRFFCGEGRTGMIEICYLEQKLFDKQNPFTAEEARFLEAVAELLGSFFKRRAAEDEVRNSEDRLRVLFDNAPDAYYLQDLNGIIVDANKAAVKLSGYSHAEIVGRHLLEPQFLAAEQGKKAADLMAQTVQGQPAGPVELVFNRKDGSPFDVEVRAFPVKTNDGVLILGIARDVTEQKKTEKRIRTLSAGIENSFDGILFTDLTGAVIYANDSAQKIFGYSQEEMMGISVMQFTARNDVPKAILDQVKKKGRWSGEIKSVKKNGQEYRTMLTVSLVKDEGGTPIGTMGVFRDVTER